MRKSIAVVFALVSMLGAVNAAVAQDAKSTPSWIWHAEGDPRTDAPAGSRYFRKTLTLDKAPDAANLEITADNHFVVWINGKNVGSGDEWATLFSFDVARHLKAGKNILAVEGINDSGPAGLVVRIHGKADGKAFAVVSDGSWKSSDAVVKDWQTAEGADAKWSAAMVLGAYGKTPPWLGGGGGAAVAANPKERFTIPDGFVMEKVVPSNAAWDGMPAGRHVSFVNCCFDAKGRLLLSQEGGPIVLVAHPEAQEPTTTLPVYCDLVKNCHGMSWVEDSLFLVGDGPQGTGLYRCTEKDDRIVSAKLLHKFNGGIGEHGPHGVFPGPDGMLYFCVGNHATAQIGEAVAKFGNPKQIAPNSPLVRWPTGGHGPDQNKPNSTEDVLIPRLNDANGHAANILAPGGTIWRLRSRRQEHGPRRAPATATSSTPPSTRMASSSPSTATWSGTSACRGTARSGFCTPRWEATSAGGPEPPTRWRTCSTRCRPCTTPAAARRSASNVTTASRSRRGIAAPSCARLVDRHPLRRPPRDQGAAPTRRRSRS